MKRSGFGGTASGQCLHQRLREEDVTRRAVILIGSGILTRFL
jgi:hypothetical protein